MACAVLLLGAPGAKAQSGALPRGELSELDASKVSAPPKKAPERPKQCTDLVANPLGVPMEFDAEGKNVWWFARLGPSATASKGPKDKADQARFTLYHLDLKSRVARPHVGIDVDGAFSMLLKRDGVSLVVFGSGPLARCFEGPGDLIDLSLDKQKEGAVQQHGEYQLVGSTAGRRIFDRVKKAVIETDSTTGQKRIVYKVPDGERPLYLDETRGLLVTFATGSGKKEIVTYKADRGKILGKERLPANARLLQGPQGIFLGLETRSSENAFKIMELSAWSGAGGSASYKITLPQGYNPLSARVDVDPVLGIALVSGESAAIRETWQRVFIYRYRLNQLLTTVPFEGSQYPNLAAISPTGDTVFIEVFSRLSQKTVGGRIVDLKTGKVKTIQITLPPQ